MIQDYSDHAANERTFLAWVRTGIAVIAFGFVVEKFNLFMLTLASSAFGSAVHTAQLARLSGPFGRYDGLALIFAGVGVVILSTARFARTTRLLDEPAAYSAKGIRVELILCAVLVLLVTSYSTFMALD